MILPSWVACDSRLRPCIEHLLVLWKLHLNAWHTGTHVCRRSIAHPLCASGQPQHASRAGAHQSCLPAPQAMRTGNVRQLNEALSQHQWTFIQTGTYLVLERLRLAVYRRLFRRVAAVHALSADPGKAHLLPLRAPLPPAPVLPVLVLRVHDCLNEGGRGHTLQGDICQICTKEARLCC